MKALPPESEWSRDIWDKLYDAVPNGEHMAARRLQTASVRDSATPEDMNRLMVGIWEKTLVSQSSSAKLLGILARCQTGKMRIKGMLPEGTEVWHKTGSLGGVVNDVGVVALPGGLGHVAISVFTKGSTRSEEASEKAIAEVARTVYDYFSLVP